MDKQPRNEQLHNNQTAAKQAGGQQSGDQWGGGKQQQQYDAGEGGQFVAQIRDRMEVIGADGARIGKLDTVEGNRIRFAASDLEPLSRPEGAFEAYLPLDKVRSIEGDKLHLKINAAEFTHTVTND
jgi:hypothetical protein